jgi:hypothetical protein
MLFPFGFMQSSSFSPKDIPNLKSWHDATQGVTLVGGAVDVWADQSGNGHNTLAVTAAQRAQYGVVTLNGYNVLSSLSANVNLRTASNYNMNASIQGGTIIFVGAQYPTDGQYGRFVSAQFDKQFWTGRNQNLQEFNGSFLAGSPPYGTPQSATDGVFYTAMYLGTTTSLQMSLNGGALPSPYNYTSSFTNNQMSFFNEPDNTYSSSVKAIAECIIYDRTLTSTEYNKVLNYLRTKWGHY